MRAAAARLGVSHQTVLRAEKGDVTLRTLIRLMKVYRVKDQGVLDDYLRTQKKLASR